jgi:hypothetical protein
MNLEESESFIRITGLCLSTEEGAVYGKIDIYKNRIEHDESYASLKISSVITKEQRVYFYQGGKSKKPQYFYKKNKMLY